MISHISGALTAGQIDAAVRDLCGSDCTVVFTRQLTGGLFNTSVYTETANPKARLVLRAAPADKSRLFVYEKTMIGAEQNLQAEMKRAGIPTTDILITRGAGIMGREYVIADYMPSVQMCDPSVGDKTGLYRELGRYTRMIHGITASGDKKFGWHHPWAPSLAFETWSGCVAFYLNEAARCCAGLGTLDDRTCSRLENAAKIYAPLLDTVTEAHMNHCDLWEPNVLVRKICGEWRIVAIIDADRAIFGDTEFEFAVQWVMNDAFLEGYGRGFDESPDAVTKRRIYSLCYSAFGAFIFKAQFIDEGSLAYHSGNVAQCLDALGA